MVSFKKTSLKSEKNYFLSVLIPQKREEQLCKNRIVVGLMEFAI